MSLALQQVSDNHTYGYFMAAIKPGMSAPPAIYSMYMARVTREAAFTQQSNASMAISPQPLFGAVLDYRSYVIRLLSRCL
jgi:hypothetical protein